MFSSEEPYVAPSQDTVKQRFNSEAIRGEDALRKIVGNHEELATENAVLSSEELEILNRAKAILQRVKAALAKA